MVFNLYWRGHATEKLTKLKNASKEDLLEAISLAIDDSKEVLRVKIERCENGKKETNESAKIKE